MPSVHAAIEYLKEIEAKGEGGESCYLHVWKYHNREKKEAKEKTKCCFDTDSHDIYVRMNDNVHRIIDRCGNKAVAWGLIVDVLDALTNPKIDRIMAIQEGPDA
jgi:hypothetical protein